MLVLAAVLGACRSDAAPATTEPSSGGETVPPEATSPPAPETAPQAEPAQEPPATVYGSETRTIEAAPGEHFSVALPEEAGLTWMLDPELDQSVARVLGDRIEGGAHHFRFEAVGIGPTDVRFHQRGADTTASTAPVQEIVVRVRVETEH